MGIYIGSDGKEYEYKRVLSMTTEHADMIILEPNITREESEKIWDNIIDDLGDRLLDITRKSFFEYLAEHPTATFEEYEQVVEQEYQEFMASTHPLIDITKEYERTHAS